ncbi:hypothetical protein HBB16_12285 [Pseudonocardia sp. MCCB 268]|nr:hypothetical protein [Pseudonocardia cytotoxica]
MLKFGLLASIPFVESLWWLLAVTLLIELCTMFWIPAKDGGPQPAAPPDQMGGRRAAGSCGHLRRRGDQRRRDVRPGLKFAPLIDEVIRSPR